MKENKVMVAVVLSIFCLSLMAQTESVVAEGCDREYSCASCSQVRICRQTPGKPGSLQEVFRLNCGGSTPFCDPVRGSCSATPSHECADLGMFPCMQDGVFPDPADCKSYHVCENGTSHTFHCEAGKYFDGTKCGNTPCKTISCSGKYGIKVPHPLNASIYAYCLKDKPLFLDRCPPGQRMYQDEQECLPECRYNGDYIANPSNCTLYYQCSYSRSEYKLIIKTCKIGQRFNPSTDRCETTYVSCLPPKGSFTHLTLTIPVH